MTMFQSTLLKSIAGEHPIKSGDIGCAGKVSYYDQEPWLLSRTIKQNILMEGPGDQTRYSQVVSASCLRQVGLSVSFYFIFQLKHVKRGELKSLHILNLYFK